MQDIENKNIENIEDIDLFNVTEQKFLDYAMSVITDRALPDSRDGLKPVHRRILFAQNQLGNYYNTQFKKSARIVGDVIGKYHPHGDTAVYDSLVRMAQPFSMRAILIQGQGNFGSIDGDNAAAMRYTECRQSKFANSMFEDLDKDVVKSIGNYDNSEQMPEVLPVRFPNLLINGTQGIAVGMATYIPPHNPVEVLNCVNYLLKCKLEEKEVSLDELMKIMPAPDFPTGGLIHNLYDMKNAWEQGRATLKLRAKWHSEETVSGRFKLVITEIPYQIMKEKLIKSISELASPDKKKNNFIQVEGISGIKDESEKDIRIVIDLKKDIDPETTFNALAKYSTLETSINYNATVLVNGSPRLLGILELLEHFLQFREEIIIKRTIFLDKKAANRSYQLEGLSKALAKLDEVIDLIKASESPKVALKSLTEFLVIDEEQAKFILDMTLSRLTSGQREDLEVELKELLIKRADYFEILNSPTRRINEMEKENDEQITLFSNTPDDEGKYTYGKRQSSWMIPRLDTDLAALTKEEECTILFSNKGYVRRVPTSDFEQQNRGTRGKRYMTLGKDDFIQKSIPSHSHDSLAIITERGQVYALKAYEISDIEKGRHLNNILEMSEGEKVLMILPIDFSSEDSFLTMMTQNGIVKRTHVSKYLNAFRKSGIKGIEIREDDQLVHAGICKNGDSLVLVNSKNLIIRFEVNAKSIRTVSRTSIGVKGMTLDDGVKVIGGAVVNSNADGYLSCITENGMVKITKIDQYRTQKRGGKGVRAFKYNEKTGDLFKALFIENLDSDLVTTTQKGISNRINLQKINVTNRNTSGVKLVKIDDNDCLADVFNSIAYENEDEIQLNIPLDDLTEENLNDVQDLDDDYSDESEDYEDEDENEEDDYYDEIDSEDND